jgi:transcriptional regulator with XRE-family HTH domain
MNAADDPKDLALAEALLVRLFRLREGKSQKELAEESGLSPRTLARLEQGDSKPRRETLNRLARAAGVPPPLVGRLLDLLRTWRTAESGRLPSFTETGPPAGDITAALAETLKLADDLLALTPSPAPWEPADTPKPEDRRRAEVLWERFIRRDRAQQSRLVRESTAFHLWSFSERLCQESRESVARSPTDALDLAQLALDVARQVRGTRSWRAHVEVNALLHLAEAQRACSQNGEAQAALSRIRQLRKDLASETS